MLKKLAETIKANKIENCYQESSICKSEISNDTNRDFQIQTQDVEIRKNKIKSFEV